MKQAADCNMVKLLLGSIAIELGKDLTNQIEINDFKDSEGHDLKMNSSFIKLKEFLDEIK